MLPRVQVRPKGPPLDFFRHYATFIKGYRLAFFEVLSLYKTFNEPKKPLFGFFGIVRLFEPNPFFEKKNNFFQMSPIVVP